MGSLSQTNLLYWVSGRLGNEHGRTPSFASIIVLRATVPEDVTKVYIDYAGFRCATVSVSSHREITPMFSAPIPDPRQKTIDYRFHIIVPKK